MRLRWVHLVPAQTRVQDGLALRFDFGEAQRHDAVCRQAVRMSTTERRQPRPAFTTALHVAAVKPGDGLRLLDGHRDMGFHASCKAAGTREGDQ